MHIFHTNFNSKCNSGHSIFGANVAARAPDDQSLKAFTLYSLFNRNQDFESFPWSFWSKENCSLLQFRLDSWDRIWLPTIWLWSRSTTEWMPSVRSKFHFDFAERRITVVKRIKLISQFSFSIIQVIFSKEKKRWIRNGTSCLSDTKTKFS